MSSHRLEIRVKPRPGLLNPEGKAIHHALVSRGWAGVEDAHRERGLEEFDVVMLPGGFSHGDYPDILDAPATSGA